MSLSLGFLYITASITLCGLVAQSKLNLTRPLGGEVHVEVFFIVSYFASRLASAPKTLY
jgi:hypothetical protein